MQINQLLVHLRTDAAQVLHELLAGAGGRVGSGEQHDHRLLGPGLGRAHHHPCVVDAQIELGLMLLADRLTVLG